MSLTGLIAGGFPDGSFDYADSRTVTDPLPLLLTRADRDRRFLLRASVLSAGSPVAVDLTSGSAAERGYGSLPTDSEHKQFTPGLAAAYNMSAALPGPDYSGWASGTVGGGGGGVRIANAGGALDAIAAYDWLGRSLDTYLGPGEPRTSLSLYTRIAAATAAGLSWDLEHVTVLYRDKRLLLQRELNERKYWGTGACLRFAAAGDVSYGDVLDQGATDSFTVEWVFGSTTAGTNKAFGTKKNSTANADAGWRVNFNATDNVVFNVSDGTNAVSAASTALTAYLNGSKRRLSCVVNRSTQLITIYVDGVTVGTSGSISAVGSLANAIALKVGGGAGVSSWSGELDDFRFWPYARTQAQIQGAMHRELTAAEAAGCGIYSNYNEGSGASAGDTSGNGRTGTITSATWVGSLEGGAEIAGKPKPRLYGQKRQFEPVLVDDQRQVWQINDGSNQGVGAVRDSGDPLTFGSDVSDIYASTPAAGTYNTCLAKGLFRLNSAPLGTLTVEAQGDNGGALGYVSSAAGICRKMAGLVFADPAGFDTVYFSALDTLTTAVCGYYSGTDDVAIDAAMETVIRSVGGWLGIERLGKLRCGRIDRPETLTSTTTLGQSGLRDPSKGGTYRRDLARVPVKQVRVGYRRYNRTLSETEVAGAVSATTRSDYGQELRFATSALSTVAPADGDILTVLTELDSVADAQAEADRLLALWEQERSVYTLSPKLGVLTYSLGDVLTLTHPRYETAAGAKAVVVGFVENFGEHRSPDEISVQALLEAA